MGCGNSQPQGPDGPPPSGLSTVSVNPKAPEKTRTNLAAVISVKIGKCSGLVRGGSKKKAQCMISFGDQTFKSSGASDLVNPEWDDVCHIFVRSNELDHKFIVGIYADNTFKSDTFIGGNHLFSVTDVIQHSDSYTQTSCSCELYPKSIYKGDTFGQEDVKGSFTAEVTVQPKKELEQGFWKQMFESANYEKGGNLDKEEFTDLIKCLTRDPNVGDVSQEGIHELFEKSDLDNDGALDVGELVTAMTQRDDLLTDETLYTYAMEVVRQQSNAKEMKGYLTQKHATLGFTFQVSEWLGTTKYETGINTGGQASYILVKDRATGRIIQEEISNVVNLSMRTAYQTIAGRAMLALPTTTELMRVASVLAGKEYDSPDSASKIPGFVETFSLPVAEIRDPLDSFKSFNEFFTRHLKPEARPISSPDDPNIAVQPADCRLMCFTSLENATELWVKGRKFTFENLLGGKDIAKDFVGGNLCISRLAPQDYHRFHSPVDGKIVSISDTIGKQYYTVNPVAVNSEVNVFTENIRKVAIIDSPVFGKVAFICVGATMVGSIVFTGMKVGSEVKKGDDLGTYKFGGSTCITCFQKGAVTFDADLLESSAKHVEVLVRMGDSLGRNP